VSERESPSVNSSKRFMAVTALVVAAAGGAALFLAQCTRTRPMDAREADRLAGATLYRTYCGLCHGDQGEGYTADDANALNNQDFLVSVSDEFLRINIADGHPGTAMAAYAREAGGPLEAVDIDLLVAFIRGWQTEPNVELSAEPIEGDIANGRSVFARECASCHGTNGRGDSALSLDNGVFLRSASDAQIEYAIRVGRRGTPMPAFAGELQDATIRDLTALIRSWEADADDTVPDAASEIGEGPAIINPDGDAPQFSALREGRYVPSEEVGRAIEAGKRLVILDARPPSDYVRFHIVGAIPSPYYGVAEVIDRIPNDGTWVIAYCACPHAASGRVMDYLREHGFENTAVLDEGVLHWREEGFPVVEGPAPGILADAE
jgi:cytochrome c oxidase cbb3-type subunit 3